MDKIYVGIYGDGKNTKYVAREVYCDNYGKCDFYKNGSCLRVVSGFVDTKCVYGRNSSVDGYTNRARKCLEWKDKIRKDPTYNKVKHPSNVYAAIVGDYVWLNLLYVRIFERTEKNRRESYQQLGWVVDNQVWSTDASFVPVDKLTPELLVKALNFRPQALMGGEIKNYKEKVVPQVVTDLRKIVPDLMTKVFELQPELDSKEDYIGRRAYVSTLKIGSTLSERGQYGIVTVSYVLCKDGDKLYLKGENRQRHFGGNRLQIVEMDVSDDMVYEIDDNSQVTSETRFV